MGIGRREVLLIAPQSRRNT